MNNLFRLVYTSARSKDCSENDIQSILEACKRNNPDKEITGILLHSDSRFLQVIEGSKEKVESLYDKVKGDPRHGGVFIRSSGYIDSREFDGWAMAYKDISRKDLQFNTHLSEQDKKIYDAMLKGEKDGVYNDRGMRVLKTFLSMD